MNPQRALLIIDVQNDFCPGGNLAVPEGDLTVPVINKLIDGFAMVMMTQDWHPPEHHSFASAHAKRKAYETIQTSYGEQILWPEHCIQGTKGAEFHRELRVDAAHFILRKGYRQAIDSYSAFFENDHKTATGLAGLAKELSVEEFVVTGLATDFCVKWSVLDGLRLGFKMSVVEDAVRGIDLEGSVEQAWEEMGEAGARRVNAGALI